MAQQTEVLFFFDTEDYTDSRSADAIVNLARICCEEDVIGHFALVGLLARQLIAWKRWDVLEALSGHEIGTHSYGHSLHPNLCELTDLAEYDAAYSALRQQETEALGMIKAATGCDVIRFAVPPGNSVSYVAMYLYADLGIPFYGDSVVADGSGSAIDYCNTRQLEYTDALEGLFFADQPLDLPALLDRYANRRQVVIYTHPNMAQHAVFWDKVNYDQTNRHPFGQWERCPERPPQETANYYRQFRQLIQAIRHDSRFRITNLRDMEAHEPKQQAVTPAMLPKIRQALLQALLPISELALSIADIFGATVAGLRGNGVALPTKNYGFLSEPIGINESCTVTAEGLRQAAADLNLNTFLPPQIRVDGQWLGPADFLFAGLDALCCSCDSIDLIPRPQLNSLDQYPHLASFRLKGTWLHSPDLADCYLSDRLRLQAWTLRRR